MAILVKALRRGFYGGKLREEGDTFPIEKEEDFGTWMERVDGEESSPEEATTKRKRGRVTDESVL